MIKIVKTASSRNTAGTTHLLKSVLLPFLGLIKDEKDEKN